MTSQNNNLPRKKLSEKTFPRTLLKSFSAEKGLSETANPSFSQEKLAKEIAWLLTGWGLKGLASALRKAARRDPRLARALEKFTGIYRFEDADSKHARYLAFRGRGRVNAMSNCSCEPDFTITIRKPSAFRRRMKPESTLEMVITNSVGQNGDTYYLYQFGFVMSLLENYFRQNRGKKKRVKKLLPFRRAASV